MVLRKRFGQHFLRDAGVVAQIISEVAARRGDVVVEIGAGGGALTAPLIASGAVVIAVELDRDWAAHLRRTFGDSVRVVEGDVLRVDLPALVGEGAPGTDKPALPTGGDLPRAAVFDGYNDNSASPTGRARGVRVVGNLPYNISTAFLLKLARLSGWMRSGHFMAQKEIGERMAAAVGGSEYGRLSVSIQRVFDVRKILDVPPRCFAPPPKVDSVFVRLTPRADAPPPRAHFDDVVRAAFLRRRKTLRNALAGREVDWARCPIDGGRRAQTLSPGEFGVLAEWVRPL